MPDKHTLLIIEDTWDLVELLAKKFESVYTVHAALSGGEGLAKAGELLPDLILLDVNLPDMTGFEVLRGIKSSEDTSDIPVLIMTAMSDTESVVTGFKTGADDYLVKPFSFTELSARISAHLTIRELRKRLIEMERLNTLKELTVSFNHEINNPLMSITAFAHFIKGRTGEGCSGCGECARGIIDEVNRISDKVRQLSEATRAATVDYQPGIKMIDMDSL